jgi:TonB-dependent SusC/RagA subfamily outer membrane receptor
MTSFSARALFRPLAMLVGLVLGYAQASGATQATQPATPTVTGEAVTRLQPSEPIEMVLMDRFPGVTVTRAANGGIAVLIRGSTSFMGSNDPLYVLDGVPFQPGPGGRLTGINPHDIASIQVLKNPAETAIYGVRGANGVIVIKTKLRR